MIARLSALALAVVLLSSCASTQQVDPAIATALSSRGVDQGTYIKVTRAACWTTLISRIS